MIVRDPPASATAYSTALRPTEGAALLTEAAEEEDVDEGDSSSVILISAVVGTPRLAWFVGFLRTILNVSVPSAIVSSLSCTVKRALVALPSKGNGGNGRLVVVGRGSARLELVLHADRTLVAARADNADSGGTVFSLPV